MALTVLKTKFQKSRSIQLTHGDYKTFESASFKNDLKLGMIGQFDSYQQFENIFMETSDKYAPMKMEIVRANQAPYVTKTPRIAIMKVCFELTREEMKKALPEQTSKHYDMLKKFIKEYLNRKESTEYIFQEINSVVCFSKHEKFRIHKGTDDSDVYIGFQKGLGWVAVKHSLMRGKEKALELIEKLMWPFKHPNILYYANYSADKIEPKMCFIVTELCNETVLEYLKKNPKERIALSADFLSGLECLHLANIIHRDLKPSNLLISRFNKVKIADFGIARDLDVKVTRLQMSIDYLPPELVGKRTVTPELRHDIFSALVLMFFMINDKHPFVEEGEDVDYDVYKRRCEQLEFKYECKDSVIQSFFQGEFERRLKKDETGISGVLHRFNNVINLDSFAIATAGSRHAILLSFSTETHTNEINNMIAKISKDPKFSINDAQNEDQKKESEGHDVVSAMGDITSIQRDSSSCNVEEKANKIQVTDDVTIKSCKLREVNKLHDKIETLKEYALISSKADVTLIKNALSSCKFAEKSNEIKVADDTTIEDLRGMLEEVKESQDNKFYSKDDNSYLWLHISSHGFYDENVDDTFLRFKNYEAVSVKSLISLLYNICDSKTKLIFTINACRKEFDSGCNNAHIIPTCVKHVVFYSCQKKSYTEDSGRADGIFIPGEYAASTPFSTILSKNITTGMKLMDVLNKTKELVNETCMSEPEIAGDDIDFTF